MISRGYVTLVLVVGLLLTGIQQVALGAGPPGTGQAQPVAPALEPQIVVSPDALAGSQPPASSMTHTLTISNMGTGTLDWVVLEENSTATGSAPAGILYDNGPLVNCPGCGFGGVADESVLQNESLGMSSFGFGHQVSEGNRIADDFTTGPEGWTIDRITFFAYQTNSNTNSTITAVNLRIWDGPPGDPGSSVVFGDTTTNLLATTTWATIYRVSETTSGTGTTRPVMANVLNVGGIYLPEGNYWLDWQSDGSLPSGPWAPPVTIDGQTTTGNALQFTGGAWIDTFDLGTFTQQDFPFILDGHPGVGGVCDPPEDIPWLSAGPTTGSTGAGESDTVEVTFDATGLASGAYAATLCVSSNDPVTPLVTLPVSMTVTSYLNYLPTMISR